MKRKETQAGVTPEADTVMTIVGTIGDTTWRMFVPSVGFTLLGVWLDGQLGSKPWLMAIGILVGFAGAYLLVKQQLARLRSKKESK